MKSISEWFDDYGESHQNQTNKKIHCLTKKYVEGTFKERTVKIDEAE